MFRLANGENFQAIELEMERWKIIKLELEDLDAADHLEA
jgi:hypothetical protein